MGFLGIVKFAVKCFDVLAWPLLGLVYPLHASIKAIESNLSSLECHKLVAYWVLFSFILLFDHSFHFLLQWLPFWPYMKLIITCCLVMPKFDGAFYVYQHLVPARLSVHTKLVIDKLKDCKDLHSNKNNIQAEVQENGFQACEEEELVSTEASLIENDKNTLAAEEIKEISEKVEEAGGELSEIQVSNQVKEEWTCSLCQVTTRSEITHISHIRGRRHKAACYELEGLRKIYSVDRKYILWWCNICYCYISCYSIYDIDCHLYGKKHLALTREVNGLYG